MAQGSLAAARLLAAQGGVRSSASRAYYAAYQSVTAILLYHGMTPPADREAWSHDAPPDLLRRLAPTAIQQNTRKDIAQRLVDCYQLRLTADYISVAEVEKIELRVALKNASYIVGVAGSILL
jgi:uncharacterized protein (UPF0332 family)